MKGNFMLESVLLPAVLGFAWGLAVSLFNNFWSWRVLNNPDSPFGRLIFVFRTLINLVAMALVYKNVVMLIATAVGLLAVKNYIFVQNLYILFRERKG